MMRFHRLWSALTVTRIRTVSTLLVAVVALPVAALIGGGPGVPPSGAPPLVVPGLALLLAVPWLYAGVRVPPRPRRSRRAGGPRNVLMVGCDTLRADRLSRLGNPENTTLSLDAMARQGTVFSNCYTPIARTAPSLVTLLTGVWPQRHGVRTNFDGEEGTRLRVPALPEPLRAHGYETVAVGDWAGSDLAKFSFGFDRTSMPDDQWNLKYLLRQGPKDIRLFLSLFTRNRLGRRFLPELYYLAGVRLTSHVGMQVRGEISRLAAADRPFLLNAFVATSHPPFGSEYPYYRMFTDPEYDGHSKFGMAKLTDPFEVIRRQREPKEAFDLNQVLGLYDGYVRNFDDELRRIVQHLWRCGLGEDTVVAVYGDHGMELFEHDTWGQGNSAVGDFSARTPLVALAPGCESRGVDDRIVRTVDLVPTILDLIGLEASDRFDGVSLVPYVASERTDYRLPAYFETGIWLTRPPGMRSDHLSYPDLLEILDVPDDHRGTLAVRPEFGKLTVDARDRMVRVEDWKLVRFALESSRCDASVDLRRHGT